jgi:hypothetical protein
MNIVKQTVGTFVFVAAVWGQALKVRLNSQAQSRSQFRTLGDSATTGGAA